MDLNLGIISEVEKKLKKKLLIDYLVRAHTVRWCLPSQVKLFTLFNFQYSNLKHHNFWAYRYFFCELLALVNIGGESILLLVRATVHRRHREGHKILIDILARNLNS